MTVDRVPDDIQPVVTAYAEAVVAMVAPKELLVFEDTQREFFTDPKIARHRVGRDEPLGFGMDLELWTPAVLAVAAAVVQFLVSAVADAAVAEGRERLVDAVRRRFSRSKTKGPEVSQDRLMLTTEQVKAVRASALERALALGVGREQAELLADAFVAVLITKS